LTEFSKSPLPSTRITVHSSCGPILATEGLPQSKRVRAAQYLRMSKDQQQYSIANQSDWISQYAAQNGVDVVRTYQDGGRSGVHIDNRRGLQALIHDVQNGKADYDVILVYDVSRWGRFLDADESAYYEYLCRRAHVEVLYCAEPFQNDRSLHSSVLKAIKRSMAGEYSRELSVKVAAGKKRLIELGFRQGGCAGYGLRRLLVDSNRQPKQILPAGTCKSVQTDRVILVPGPEHEILVVREIYDSFGKAGRYETAIARSLNERGLVSHLGKSWEFSTVHEILTNPKYMGVNVYRRTSGKLSGHVSKNPPSQWLWRKDAFEPVISPTQFDQVRAIMEKRRIKNEQLLTEVQELLAENGSLSLDLIDRHTKSLGAHAIARRFGGVNRLYSLIGYKPRRDFTYIRTNKELREAARQHRDALVSQLRSDGVCVVEDSKTGVLTLSQELRVHFDLIRCREMSGYYRWTMKLLACADIVIGARMKPGNEEIMDYYLLPPIDCESTSLQLGADNPMPVDIYRHRDLNGFLSCARRVSIGEAA
jgi:DNA invertase Pin-like site-specific DNA recombinase